MIKEVNTDRIKSALMKKIGDLEWDAKHSSESELSKDLISIYGYVECIHDSRVLPAYNWNEDIVARIDRYVYDIINDYDYEKSFEDLKSYIDRLL